MSNIDISNVGSRVSKRYGFETDIIGKEFTNKLGKYKIKEFNISNRLYPIVATCSNGKTYNLSPTQVKMYFK